MTKILTPDELWKELMDTQEEEPWSTFKTRLLQNGNKSIVYEREGRKMLNVYACRGFKRMLTENGKVTKKRWIQILTYFTPIVHKEKSKYQIDSSEEDVTEGFTLLHIAATLDLPAFLGPATDEHCKKYLSERTIPGEHCYRFSSTPGQFVIHLVEEDRSVNAYKIYNIPATHKLYLAFKNIKEEFKTLADLEHNFPEWKTKWHLPFVEKKEDEFETLDDKEKELLEWVKKIELAPLYAIIMKNLSTKMDYEESLEGFMKLKEDASFQASLDNATKEKLENAFKEDKVEKEKSSVKTGKTKVVKKKVVKKKEKTFE